MATTKRKSTAFCDSEAEFKARLEQVGLDRLWEAFRKAKWTTYADFLFAPSGRPGELVGADFRTP